MPRARRTPTDRNRTIGVTPSKDTREWLDPQVGPGRRWSSYTHFVDWAAARIREEDEELRRRLDAAEEG